MGLNRISSRRRGTEVAVFKHKALLIIVNRSAPKSSLYEAARYAWKVDRNRAAEAEVILAVINGRIAGAFVAHAWLKATAANFPGREGVPGRWGFIGEEAPEDIASLYVDKQVPDEYRKPGASNPIKYTW